MSDETLEIEMEQEPTPGEILQEEAPPQAVMRPPQPSPSPKASEAASLDMLMDVILQLTVELGRTELTVRQVLDLQKGSVVELDRIAGDAVDVFVNDHLIAKGEVVVVDDKFGVRITELVSPMRESVEAAL
ncbi:MAG: Flagellar motor switch protein FliN [Anaerolineae bacterium]|jgi:flagellar motor switch protein FliN/FliY|nr:MAG: Flagellar motor switch protein FliN [Anaerolineae bacterium]